MINEMIKQGYQIHFKGETLPGTQIGDVKRKLASLLGLGNDKADSMFNGKQIVLKKDLDEDTAKKYLHVLQKIGAKTYVYPELPDSSNQDLEATGRFSVGLKTCAKCKSIQQAGAFCKECGSKLDSTVPVPKIENPAINVGKLNKAPTLKKTMVQKKSTIPQESILSLAAKKTVAFGKQQQIPVSQDSIVPEATKPAPAKKPLRLHLGTTKTTSKPPRQRLTPPPKQQAVRSVNPAQRITPVNQSLPVRSESKQTVPQQSPRPVQKPVSLGKKPVTNKQAAVQAKQPVQSKQAIPAKQPIQMRSQRRPTVRPNTQSVQVRTQSKQLVPSMPGVPAVRTADLSTDSQLQALENRQPAIGTWNKEHDEQIKVLQKNALWGINLGFMLLAAVYFVDMLAQSVGIDIGSNPYWIALLPFPVGCWFLAISKGYPGPFGGLIGLGAIPGVALLILMPVRYEHESRFEMGRSTLVAIIALGLSAYWGYSQVHELNLKEKYLHDIAQMQKMRSDYPAGIIEANENRFDKVVQKMEKLVVTGPRIIKTSSFRPTEVTELSHKLFHEFTSFFTWINYQRHLHYIQVGKIPEFLAKPNVSKLMQGLKMKLDNGLIETEDSRLNQAYNDWILGVPVTEDLQAITQIHFTLNYIKDRIEAYVDKHGKFPVSFETMGRFKPDQSQFKVASVSLDKEGVLTLITGDNSFADLSQKTIVMTGIVHTTVKRKIIRGKRRRVATHELEFFRIGGNLSNRYLKEPYSVFSKW